MPSLPLLLLLPCAATVGAGSSCAACRSPERGAGVSRRLAAEAARGAAEAAGGVCPCGGVTMTRSRRGARRCGCEAPNHGPSSRCPSCATTRSTIMRGSITRSGGSIARGGGIAEAAIATALSLRAGGATCHTCGGGFTARCSLSISTHPSRKKLRLRAAARRDAAAAALYEVVR